VKIQPITVQIESLRQSELSTQMALEKRGLEISARLNSPEYPDKLGQSWRHEAIVSEENGAPFVRTKKICCFQSRIVWPALSRTFCDQTLRRRISGHFGSGRTLTVF